LKRVWAWWIYLVSSCVAAGGIAVLAFAPFHRRWAAETLIFLAVLLYRVTWRQAALCTFLFGLSFYACGIWWLYISVHHFGGAPVPLAVAATAGLIVFLACLTSLVGLITAALAPAGPGRLLVFPSAWVLVEWLRSWILSGFPWLLLGYSQVDGLFGALAPVGGVLLVSWVSVFWVASLAWLVEVHGWWRWLGLVGIVLCIGVVQPFRHREWTQPTGPRLDVALVQGDIPQDMKWNREAVLFILQRYFAMTGPLLGTPLVVWPEAALPLPVDDLWDSWLQPLDDRARQEGTTLLLGALKKVPPVPGQETKEQYGNALLALGRDRGIYIKRHLVPFGEYFPLPAWGKAFLKLLSLPYEDLQAGPLGQAPLVVHGQRVAASICYEDAFGAERRLDEPSAFLVNVSNDAWFGDSIAPHQHLEIGRMRALELNRPMLRAANTGITAIIDHRGHVVRTIPQFIPGVLRGTIQGRSGKTPYSRYGDGPVLILLALTLLASAAFRFYGRFSGFRHPGRHRSA
jgi:apolipoprotein N-acyltransferase